MKKNTYCDGIRVTIDQTVTSWSEKFENNFVNKLQKMKFRVGEDGGRHHDRFVVSDLFRFHCDLIKTVFPVLHFERVGIFMEWRFS